MVTISHKPKHIYIFINKDSGQPRHEHHTCQRDQQIEYHETRHEIHSKTLYRYQCVKTVLKEGRAYPVKGYRNNLKQQLHELS